MYVGQDLKDFLENNLIIAQLCGFDILKPLPSYWVFQRFIKNLSNSYLKEIMKNQDNLLKELGFIDNNFVSVDATPVKANTKFNNPKCFSNNKFSKKNPPTSDKDCKLGVHTANNSMNIKVSGITPINQRKIMTFTGVIKTTLFVMLYLVFLLPNLLQLQILMKFLLL